MYRHILRNQIIKTYGNTLGEFIFKAWSACVRACVRGHAARLSVAALVVFPLASLFLCSVTCTFTNTLKFVVKDCDPSTGEPDEEGYEDEYVVGVHLPFDRLLLL